MDLKDFIMAIRPYAHINHAEVMGKAMSEGINLADYQHLSSELTPQERMLYAVLMVDDKHEDELTFGNVIRVKREATGNSGSPKWVMDIANDSKKMYIFEHTLPQRNTITLFDIAGWGELLRKMELNDVLNFTQTPIRVALETDSNGFYRPKRIMLRNNGDTDDISHLRIEARATAYDKICQLAITENVNFYAIDTETTGLADNAEVISIAIVSWAGGIIYNSLVKPSIAIEPGATKVHGFTDKDLVNAPTFDVVWNDIRKLLRGVDVWAWNAEYDSKVIQNSINANIERIADSDDKPFVINCAMNLYAQYNGEWSQKRKTWQSVSLANARIKQGLPDVDSHNAVTDATSIIEIFNTIAYHPLD